jgi:hypothetical protein
VLSFFALGNELNVNKDAVCAAEILVFSTKLESINISHWESLFEFAKIPVVIKIVAQNVMTSFNEFIMSLVFVRPIVGRNYTLIQCVNIYYDKIVTNGIG